MADVIDTDYLPDCPCLNCICVAVCRHKLYHILHRDCFDVKLYLPGKYDDISYSVYDKKAALKLALQPTTWDMDREGFIIQLRGNP